jgi:dethiobiotin synthetase
MAAAPLVAARDEAREVDLELIEQVFEEGIARADLTLVEGAGGWRVPICAELDMGGLAGRLGLPVIIVARAGLGTLNHTLLTAEAVERDRQRLVVVVLSERPSEPEDLVSTNVEEIGIRLGVGVIRLRTDSKILDPLILRE